MQPGASTGKRASGFARTATAPFRRRASEAVQRRRSRGAGGEACARKIRFGGGVLRRCTAKKAEVLPEWIGVRPPASRWTAQLLPAALLGVIWRSAPTAGALHVSSAGGARPACNPAAHARWPGLGSPSLREAVRWGSEVYQALRQILLEKGLSVGVGDEGGFAPAVASNRQPLELIVQAIEKATPGEDIAICMDPASSEFYADGKYRLRSENLELDAAQMTAYYQRLVQDFPIVLIEDGLAEDDWAGWRILSDALGDQVELVGDDLFVTNVKYIQRGIDERLANAALIKLNQIGTLSETFAAVQLCQANGWGTFISHRSGETVDSFIADMTVAMRAGHLKTGAPSRGERIEKYNQLMRIEDQLGAAAVYAGRFAFKRR